MAGFWNKSQSQIQDVNGKPMVGAKAYFYLGGTTTPIAVYGAYALGAVNVLPNPVVSDGNGFFPSVFFDEDDAFYHLRITTAGGVIILDVDGLPIIGPSGGGGGGGDNPVNPDAVLTTGDIKYRYDDGFVSGYVRLNARTIGSAISGASERANADTQALFEYLWNKDADLVVLGGRGASSSADWAANKQITLPDYRGRALIGLDGMGNTAAGLVPEVSAVGDITGDHSHLLTVAEMPYHGHPFNEVPHQHDFGANVPVAVAGSAVPSATGGSSAEVISHTLPAITNSTIGGTGGGLAHSIMQPSAGITIYMRL